MGDIAKLLEGTGSNPEEIRSKIKEISKNKRNTILGKTYCNSSSPTVIFQKIEDCCDIWVWVEFKDYVTDRDKESFENALNAYFIIGRLGGFNSLNLQTFFTGQKELSFLSIKAIAMIIYQLVSMTSDNLSLKLIGQDSFWILVQRMNYLLIYLLTC